LAALPSLSSGIISDSLRHAFGWLIGRTPVRRMDGQDVGLALDHHVSDIGGRSAPQGRCGALRA
jgi:hypothetical protein